MRRHLVAAAVLSVLWAASAYAQQGPYDERDVWVERQIFFLIVKTGTPEAVQAAIEQGAEVNAMNDAGFTPLILAVALNPDPDVIVTLLKAGAEVNARDTRFGMTPLMWAAMCNENPKAIAILKNAGARTDPQDAVGLAVPLAASSISPNAEVIETLVNPGVTAIPGLSNEQAEDAYLPPSQDRDDVDMNKRLQQVLLR